MSKDKWKGSPYIVTTLAVLIAVTLFREFGSEGPTGLNVLIGLILLVMVVGAFLLSRFLSNNIAEIGEARFDTADKDEL